MHKMKALLSVDVKGLKDAADNFCQLDWAFRILSTRNCPSLMQLGMLMLKAWCAGGLTLYTLIAGIIYAWTVIEKDATEQSWIWQMVQPLKNTLFEKSIFVQKFNFDKNLNIFTNFSPKIFLTIFLVKSKLSTAKKSKTTTFSRVFHPKKSQEIKVEVLDKKWRFRTVWRKAEEEGRQRQRESNGRATLWLQTFWGLMVFCISKRYSCVLL